jgi:predicted amidohydrolase
VSRFTLAASCLLAACGGVEHAPFDASGTTDRLPVTLASLLPDLNPEVNRGRMRDRVTSVMEDHPETRLIAFGETAFGWYFKAGDATYQRTVAEPIDGTSVSLMRALARQHHVYLSFGFAELAEGKLYDAAVLIDDAGEIIAHHRKSNFVPMDDASGFTRGEKKLTTAFIDGIKVALLVCADFNELLYQEGVQADPEIEVVLLPQASAGLTTRTVRTSPFPYKGAWLLAPQRLGLENGDRYHGSWIVDPNGAVPAEANGVDEDVIFTLGVNATRQ